MTHTKEKVKETKAPYIIIHFRTMNFLQMIGKTILSIEDHIKNGSWTTKHYVLEDLK